MTFAQYVKRVPAEGCVCVCVSVLVLNQVLYAHNLMHGVDEVDFTSQKECKLILVFMLIVQLNDKFEIY